MSLSDTKEINQVALNVISSLATPEVIPLKNLSMFLNNDLNRSSLKQWHTLEFKNLEEIECSDRDWVTCGFFILDISLSQIKDSFLNGGYVINDSFYFNCKHVYLILRENINGPVKPIIGMCYVVDKNDINLRIQYLCLSRPHYVTTPWCDEKTFTHGQQITLKEDVQILLEEYLMSLKHKKAVPVFSDKFVRFSTNIFLFSCRFFNLPDGGFFFYFQPWSEATYPFLNYPIASHGDRLFAQVKMLDKCQPFERNFTEPMLKDVLNTPTSVANEYSCSISTTNLSNINRCNDNEESISKKNKYKLPTCIAPDFKNRAFNVRASNATPPLLGLNGRVSSRSWYDIESSNLASLISSKCRKTFYLCDSSLKAIKQSFRTSTLDISERNMENIANSERCRKYFILRAVLSKQRHGSIIGICNVVMSADVIRTSNNRYSVTVGYLTLSPPAHNYDVLEASCKDGSEVPINNLFSFFEEYFFALKQGKLKPIFNDVYVSL